MDLYKFTIIDKLVYEEAEYLQNTAKTKMHFSQFFQ